MTGWREMASRLIAEGGGGGATVTSAPLAPALDLCGLPEELAAGVRNLPDRRPPRIAKPEVWRGIVDDASRLTHDGWAAKALALGWSPHDVFGVGLRSSDAFEGLAVWLAGRSVAALTEWKARTECGATFYRDDYLRPNSPKAQPVFLWEFGR